MTNNYEHKPRRNFLIKSVTSAASVASLSLSNETQARDEHKSSALIQNPQQGYLWLRPSEQGFVESLVNHLCPADRLSPNGVEIGLNIYFDRALGGNWGQGDRLYLKGPFLKEHQIKAINLV
jgi:gluconate 2-dehydrogenase gamma chain